VDKPVAAPGERFIYSDINFILLGEIVRKVGGKPLDRYAKDKIFLPLGMKETTFNPPESWRGRIAPTEHYKGMAGPLRGVVHDETTRFMGGVAGHAGLFTTAEDLSKFAEMVLSLGAYAAGRLYSPLTVRKATSPQSPPDQSIWRGLGWDMDSPYSGNRGELFPLGSFGHTGFTGTSLWIDPQTQTYVILLTNSVHPMRRPAITSLRARVATAAAAALGVDAEGVAITSYNETVSGPGARRAGGRNGRVATGIDVLVTEKFARLMNRKIGLITNHTGLTRDGKRDVDVMLAGGLKVVAMFAPEHGIAGTEDHEKVADLRDQKTGLPVRSLYYGEQRRPNEEMLKGIDTLVFDIQDVGARFYTYGCTMLNAMEEASKRGITFVVLDRPNPITGVYVEGPMIEKDLESFVGCFKMPLRHGMTIGELARMFHDERQMKGKLEIVRMKNWHRGDWFDSTGLTWLDPSPNIRSLSAALLFPGVAMIEYSRNYSVGRGTDAPFEQAAADWIDATRLAELVNGRAIPGVRVYPTRFTPRESVLKGIPSQGLRFVITDRERFRPVRFGVELAYALEKLHPGKIPFEKSERLIGSRKVIQSLRHGRDPRLIEQDWDDDLRAFLIVREKYLLYR
jgi:uncharacterized protein YbbC (DUF1343 family)